MPYSLIYFICKLVNYMFNIYIYKNGQDACWPSCSSINMNCGKHQAKITQDSPGLSLPQRMTGLITAQTFLTLLLRWWQRASGFIIWSLPQPRATHYQNRTCALWIRAFLLPLIWLRDASQRHRHGGAEAWPVIAAPLWCYGNQTLRSRARGPDQWA